MIGPSFSPALRQTPYPAEELKALIHSADAVFTAGSYAAFTPELLTPTPPRLRGIVTSSLGHNWIDVQACTERGILVSNSPVDTNYEGVFQHTLLLILALKRRLRYFEAWARSGEPWSRLEVDALPDYLDEHTTLGVVGLGRIGYRVARAFRQMFGTRVVAYDPYAPEDRAQQIGVRMVGDLRDLLRVADIVTLHTFLSDETHHLIGEPELRLMKPAAVIVNTSRGPVIDEAALITALREGWIAGAGLDVAEVEPLRADDLLLSMDNVVVTPHIGGASVAQVIRASEYAAESVLALVNGKVPKVVVNPEAIPAWVARFGITGARHGGFVYYRS